MLAILIIIAMFFFHLVIELAVVTLGVYAVGIVQKIWRRYRTVQLNNLKEIESC